MGQLWRAPWAELERLRMRQTWGVVRRPAAKGASSRPSLRMRLACRRCGACSVWLATCKVCPNALVPSTARPAAPHGRTLPAPACGKELRSLAGVEELASSSMKHMSCAPSDTCAWLILGDLLGAGCRGRSGGRARPGCRVPGRGPRAGPGGLPAAGGRAAPRGAFPAGHPRPIKRASSAWLSMVPLLQFCHWLPGSQCSACQPPKHRTWRSA